MKKEKEFENYIEFGTVELLNQILQKKEELDREYAEKVKELEEMYTNMETILKEKGYTDKDIEEMVKRLQ